MTLVGIGWGKVLVQHKWSGGKRDFHWPLVTAAYNQRKSHWPGQILRPLVFNRSLNGQSLLPFVAKGSLVG